MLLLQGPGQVSAELLPTCSAEKAISIIVYTVLFNYRLDVPSPFIFFLGFNSVHFLPETGLAGSSSIILGDQWLPSLFSPPFQHAVPFAAPTFLQKHVLSLASLNDVMFINRSGIKL